MNQIVVTPAKTTELSWLSEVVNSHQFLSESVPIYVRCGVVRAGPPEPHPERHPYCEIGTLLKGGAVAFVESEQASRARGDVLLLGPGVPHSAAVTRYPLRFITVYFLPSVIIELGPNHDGPQILRRFTARQSLRERLVRFPPRLRDRCLHRFERMAIEFERKEFGCELRLRILLMEQILELFRWEEKTGQEAVEARLKFDWDPVNKALQYMREHYSEPIYGRNLARVAGVSQSRLRSLFHNAIGMPWVKYLRCLRIHRAAALLRQEGLTVTQAALAAGFESHSNFCAAFRSFFNVSPTAYQTRKDQKRRGTAPASRRSADLGCAVAAR